LDRFVLNDAQWERVAPLLFGKIGDPGRSGADNRLFLEAMLWIARVGTPWRDLPEMLGNTSTRMSKTPKCFRLEQTNIYRDTKEK